MISCVRDIGAELTDRALAAGDIDLARWAAARALVAAPGDELLLAARIRTEHLAGNPAETERLTLQLAAQARTLGVDLDPGDGGAAAAGDGGAGAGADLPELSGGRSAQTEVSEDPVLHRHQHRRLHR